MEDRNERLSSKIANAIVISGILVFISIIGLFIKSKKLSEKYNEDIDSFKKEIRYAEKIAISGSNVHRFSGNLINISDSKEASAARININKNVANLNSDIDGIKNFKNIDSKIGDSLVILEKQYLNANEHFLSLIDSGKKDEARTFSHDIRRPAFEKFQAEQETFFNAISENTSSLPQKPTIWTFNAYWVLFIIGLLPLSVLFIVIIYFAIRVVIGEIVGI
jgi:hypothetical protein